MNKSEYRALVQEGKSLVLQGAAGRLRLGEIAQEIAPKGEGWGGDRSSATPVALDDYAAEIDIEASTLRQYRDVTLRWGGKAPKTSWSVLRELAFSKYGDDPLAAYKAIKAQHGKVTIITVRDYLGKKTAGVRSTSPVEDKVAQVQELLQQPEVAAAATESVLAAVRSDRTLATTVVKAALQEPEVAEAAVEDDETRWAVNRADSKRSYRLTEQRKEDIKRDFPELAQAVSNWGGQTKFNTALEALQSAYRLFSDSPALTEADRAHGLRKLAEIRQWVDHLTALLEGRDPYDAGLEKLLNEA